MQGSRGFATQYLCTVAEYVEMGYNHTERCERRKLADSTNCLKNGME
jgi:hypothetical protein